jgi:TonB family protein
MARWSRAIFGVLGLLAADRARAQSAGSQPPPAGRGGIVGVVRDSAGVEISGAQVTISGVLGRGISGADGAFRLVGVPSGAQVLVARRIGFRPDSQAVTVIPARTIEVEIRLAPAPAHIATVVVDGTPAPPPARLRGFHERRARGFGHYFTEADIARRNPMVVTDLLRSLPSVRVNQGVGQSVITFRGMRCPPLIWVDGTAATAGYLDPDVLLPSTLAGVEVYPGPATVPAELMVPRGKDACGVIALWSKTPPPRPRANRPAASDDHAPPVKAPMYTVDQVDVPAEADTLYPVLVTYPDSLLRAGVAGRALVEFVVDSTGLPEMDSFRAVLSTHPLFTDAARRAVGDARFKPARRRDQPVRQLIQLPLTFPVPTRN